MDWYKHYVGDFKRDTSHLSLTERGAYLALMHHYYATEEALPVDHVALCRIAGAMTKQERDAVKVAATFFEKRGGKLWHKRIEAECAKAEGRADKNREIAVAREAKKRAAKLAETDNRTEHEPSTIRAQVVPDSCNEPQHENSTIPDYQTPDYQTNSVESERVTGNSSSEPPEKITHSLTPVDVFPMDHEWCPSIEFEKNLPPSLIADIQTTLRDLQEFRLYRIGTGQKFTQAQWENLWLKNLESNKKYREVNLA